MYETVRDIIKAERAAGHEAILVDIGKREEGKWTRSLGQHDARAGLDLEAQDWGDALDADLFAVSGGITDDFLKRTTTPCVQILHGRPYSSFLLSLKDPKAPVYQIYARYVAGNRFKKFVTLWEEFVPFWRALIPDDRLAATEYPPCDLDAYAPEGDWHVWGAEEAAINILVADQMRDDIDPYYLIHVLLELTRIWRGPKIKAHFYALHAPLGPYEFLFAALRKAGILGETCGQMVGIERRYRAADLVLSPHVIATRVIREALACGCPVVAARPCRHTPWTIPQGDNPAIAAASLRSILELFLCDRAKDEQRTRARELAQPFALDRFVKSLIPIYESVLKGDWPWANDTT